MVIKLPYLLDDVKQGQVDGQAAVSAYLASLPGKGWASSNEIADALKMKPKTLRAYLLRLRKKHKVEIKIPHANKRNKTAYFVYRIVRATDSAKPNDFDYSRTI